MNIQSEIPNDHNADTRFATFDAKLDAISTDVRSAHTLLHSHNTSIYSAVGKTLDLGYAFTKKRDKDKDHQWEFLKDYLTFHGEKWSLRCETSIFHGLVSIAFNQIDEETNKPINSAPSLSKYRAVLRYASKRKLTSKKLIEDLEEYGLDDIYQVAMNVLRFDPIDNYVENHDERFAHASQHLADLKSLPSAVFTTELPRPNTDAEFMSAIIKLTDRGFDVVGLLPAEAEEQIQTKVINLTPSIAKHKRQKLKDKNLYQLYVLCDLYKRFLPKVSDIRAWNKASKHAKLPQLPENPSQQETDDYLRALKAQSDEQQALKKAINEQLKQGIVPTTAAGEFTLLNVLEFRQIAGNLMASSLTTHPNTPCWTFSIPMDKPRFDPDVPLMIKDYDAERFSTQFLEYHHWSLKRKGYGLIASSTHNEAKDLLLQDYSQMDNWRSLDKDLQVISRYSMDKFHLDMLDHWKSAFAARPNFLRMSFQSIMVVNTDGGNLELMFPNDRDQKRPLGVSQQLKTNIKMDKERLFDFRWIEKLIKLAMDYGLEFEFDLLKSHQGETALRFHCIGLPFNASITIPLLLSVKGNPVEITRTI